jgi:hypothetical protein
MGRFLAFVLIVFGFYFFAGAAYDEYRGIASATSPGRYSQSYAAKREDDPKQFRGLMTYQWGRAILVTIGGFIINGICQRADESDPISHKFGGKSSVTDLDRTIAEEEKRRRGRPVE